MSLAVMLSMEAHDQASIVFSVIFVIVWVGAAIITINGQLLGGRLYVVPEIDLSTDNVEGANLHCSLTMFRLICASAHSQIVLPKRLLARLLHLSHTA